MALWHQCKSPFSDFNSTPGYRQQSQHFVHSHLRLLSSQTQWNLENTFTKSTAPYCTISKIFKSQHSTEITRCWHLPYIFIFICIYIFITTIRRDVHLQTMSHSLPRQHSTLQPSNVYAQKAIVPSNRTTRCIMQLIHKIMHFFMNFISSSVLHL